MNVMRGGRKFHRGRDRCKVRKARSPDPKAPAVVARLGKPWLAGSEYMPRGMTPMQVIADGRVAESL